jgi:hypothetical protein
MNVGEVDTSITLVKTLYIVTQGQVDAVLAPNPHGHPLPVRSPQPLRRAVYVEPFGDLGATVKAQVNFLGYKSAHLLAFLSSDLGGDLITARVFTYNCDEKIDVADNLRRKMVSKYLIGTEVSGHSWIAQYRAGQPGYFLTGHDAATNLWRIARLESDAFGGTILTLRPIRLRGDLPDLTLDSVQEPLVRDEIAHNYRDLQGALTGHSFRSVVTASKNIVESATRVLLHRAGLEPGKALFDNLNALKEKRVTGFSDLSFHAAHKIRLMHARTHVDRATSEAPVDPELALSCVEDLKHVLREAGLTAAGK